MPVKTLSEILKTIVDVEQRYQTIPIQNLANNSGDVTKDTLFLALQGNKTDGRRYILEAIEKGASAICLDANAYDDTLKAPVPLIPVQNLKQHQATLASTFYDNPSFKIPVVGVTGTNGKSSITQFIAQAFDGFKKTGVIGTTGYGFLPHLTPSKNTTPDPIRLQKIIADCVQRDANLLAMEVSSHGLVEKRVENIRFHTGVFTNLTQDHLDFHGTMENYRDAKAMLFEQPLLQHAIFNLDNQTGKDFARHFSKKISTLTFSTSAQSKADIVATEYQFTASGFRAMIQSPWGRGELTSSLLGRFNLENCLAVISVLGIFDMPFQTILERVSALSPVAGRMVVYAKPNYPAVVVDYAHTPDALENALNALKHHCAGKLWCVFGCGGDRDKSKRAQMGAIAARLCDQVIVTNDNPRSESPDAIANDILSGMQNQRNCHVILDRAQAIEYAMTTANEDDLILVAGKGHETTQTIGNQDLPFNDGEVVLNALRSSLR